MTTSAEPTVRAPQRGLPQTVRRQRRRRRPTGAAPPLPRKIGVSGKVWLGSMAALLVWVVVAMVSDPVMQQTERLDTWVLRRFASLRTAWLTHVVDKIDRAATGWLTPAIAIGMILALIAFRRWRHLFTFLASVALLEVVGSWLYENFSRPRPYGVDVIGRWSGFSMPSSPIALFTVVFLSIAYTLVVPGRPRTIAKIVVAVAVTALVFARLYLAVDHPLDILVGVALAVTVPLTAFRLFTPNDVFPVTYRRSKTAHLDVGGARGEAIRRAVRDQLGLMVIALEPVGLEGSGGSTPLKLTVAGDPDVRLFGKLLAMNHVRADRWYKLGRQILYGRLEDEAPFHSVQRLVEHEDYALRVLSDADIPTARPYGIVEITPSREYMLVTEFLLGAKEIGEADINDNVIDEGLIIIRKLWDAGLAHRDIKPANLLVRDGHVMVVDVAFVQIRPSPWRQAVDLANMMLVLAVRTDAERVYTRALQFFTPDEIGEAFAAARGIASPTQLRTAMKRDGRNLIAQFRKLAPEHPPISLQRWSIRRVLMAVGFVALAVVAVLIVSTLMRPADDIPVAGSPDCGTENLMVLMAQSVPSATSLPCLAALPAGWDLGSVKVRNGHATFWLDSDQAGKHALEATLTAEGTCDLRGGVPVPSDEVGTQRFDRPTEIEPRLKSMRFYVFPGGCVTYRFDFPRGVSPDLLFDADQALAFEPRGPVVRQVAVDSRQRLCGADVPCPG